MKIATVTGSCLLAAALSGCGTAPPPSGTPPVGGTSTAVAPGDRPAVSASATVIPEAPPPDDGTGVLKLHRVQAIWSLFDVVITEGTVELRIGYDPGGGMIGNFRYVPVVNGVPDLAEETSEINHVDTTGGILEIAGKRPNLVLHIVAGFRSAGSDSYTALGEDNHWGKPFPYSGGEGTGIGLTPWSGGRLLEWRQPPNDSPVDARLPMFGVARGTPAEAPSIPKALAKRLVKAGYTLETYRAFTNGEIVAVGRLPGEKGFGTLVWKDKIADPTYVVTEPNVALANDTELAVLGGNSLADVRLRVGDAVMSWGGAAWAEESTVAKGGLPDVFFGTTLVQQTKAGTFARFEKGGTWRKLARDPDVVVVDGAGVIWAVEGEALFSSKAPAAKLPDVPEPDLVSARKASILRGGSRDATGESPSTFSQKCSMSYVLLDRKDAISDTDDYAAVRKALTGHSEFAKARFIVTRERGKQFFGALLADDQAAEKLAGVVTKAIKGSVARAMCAEPPSVREVKIDLASGALLK